MSRLRETLADLVRQPFCSQLNGVALRSHSGLLAHC